MDADQVGGPVQTRSRRVLRMIDRETSSDVSAEPFSKLRGSLPQIVGICVRFFCQVQVIFVEYLGDGSVHPLELLLPPPPNQLLA